MNLIRILLKSSRVVELFRCSEKLVFVSRGDFKWASRTFDSFDFLFFAYGGVFLDFNHSFFLRFLLESKRFQSIVVDAIQSSFS